MSFVCGFLFHACRPPAVFPWLSACQDGPFLSLEDVILEKILELSYKNVEDEGHESEGKQKQFYAYY